ncbi:uncharacterized protein [Onthophagus taurus]|uniref:uncharacterized protein n=1 Tax=Onthophagus taurus TaxID=166361 RepID=UPI0039BEC0BA
MASFAERDFWEKFINLYRMYPCLWDTKSKNYINKNLKPTAINELVKFTKERFPQANADFVQKKIHTLRGNFRRELGKVRKSLTATGRGQDDTYIPKLWYYDHLSFISNTETPRPGRSNIDTEEEEEEKENETQSKTLPDDDETIRSARSSSILNIRSPQTPLSTSSLEVERIKKSKIKKKSENELIGLANEALKKFCSSNEIIENDFDIAGKKYATDLKTLETNQRVILEKLVSDAMYYAKLGKLTETASVTTGPSNSGQYNTEWRFNMHAMPPHHTMSPHTQFTDLDRATSNTSQELLTFNYNKHVN